MPTSPDPDEQADDDLEGCDVVLDDDSLIADEDLPVPS